MYIGLLILVGLFMLVNMLYNGIVNTVKNGVYRDQIQGWYSINITKIMWVNISLFIILFLLK